MQSHVQILFKWSPSIREAKLSNKSSKAHKELVSPVRREPCSPYRVSVQTEATAGWLKQTVSLESYFKKEMEFSDHSKRFHTGAARQGGHLPIRTVHSYTAEVQQREPLRVKCVGHTRDTPTWARGAGITSFKTELYPKSARSICTKPREEQCLLHCTGMKSFHSNSAQPELPSPAL